MSEWKATCYMCGLGIVSDGEIMSDAKGFKHNTQGECINAARKKCPVCGGGPEKAEAPDGGQYIRCKYCNLATALHYDRCENLEAAWEQRTLPDEVEQIIEAATKFKRRGNVSCAAGDGIVEAIDNYAACQHLRNKGGISAVRKMCADCIWVKLKEGFGFCSLRKINCDSVRNRCRSKAVRKDSNPYKLGD